MNKLLLNVALQIKPLNNLAINKLLYFNDNELKKVIRCLPQLKKNHVIELIIIKKELKINKHSINEWIRSN